MTITCFIRYEIDPYAKADFEEYARNWGQAIPRCGADLIGYFAPHEGSATTAYGVYNIDSLAAYEAYRGGSRPTRSARRTTTSPGPDNSSVKEDRIFLKLVSGRMRLKIMTGRRGRKSSRLETTPDQPERTCHDPTRLCMCGQLATRMRRRAGQNFDVGIAWRASAGREASLACRRDFRVTRSLSSRGARSSSPARRTAAIPSLSISVRIAGRRSTGSWAGCLTLSRSLSALLPMVRLPRRIARRIRIGTPLSI